MMPLTDTQRDILNAAAQQPEHLACPPRRLPTGARQSVAKALMRQGLVPAEPPQTQEASAIWTLDGESVVLQITESGLAAFSTEVASGLATMPKGAPGQQTSAKAPVSHQDGKKRPLTTLLALNLRKACAAFLETWDVSPATGRHG